MAVVAGGSNSGAAHALGGDEAVRVYGHVLRVRRFILQRAEGLAGEHAGVQLQLFVHAEGGVGGIEDDFRGLGHDGDNAVLGNSVVRRCGDDDRIFLQRGDLAVCVDRGNGLVGGGVGDHACGAFVHGGLQRPAVVHADGNGFPVQDHFLRFFHDGEGAAGGLAVVSFDSDLGLAGCDALEQAVRGDGGDVFVGGGVGQAACRACGQPVAQLHFFADADGVAGSGALYAGGRFFDGYFDFTACAGIGGDGDIGRTKAPAVDFSGGVYGHIAGGAGSVFYVVRGAFGGKFPEVCQLILFIQADIQRGSVCDDLRRQGFGRCGHHHDGIGYGKIDEEAGFVRIRRGAGGDFGDDGGDGFSNGSFAAGVVQAQGRAFVFHGFGQDSAQFIRAGEGGMILFAHKIVVFGAGGCGVFRGFPFVVAEHGRIGQAEVQAGGFFFVVKEGVDMGPFAFDLCDIPCRFAFDYAAFDAGGFQQHGKRQRIAHIIGAAADNGSKRGAFFAGGRAADQLFIQIISGFVFIAGVFGFGCPGFHCGGKLFFRGRRGFRGNGRLNAGG